MKKNNSKARKAIIFTLVFISILNLTSCDTSKAESLEITGNWLAGGTWRIEDDNFSVTNDPSWNWDYSGEIISFNNNSYNIRSENPVSGNFGYMVIKYTAHTGDSSQIGTYNVVRWNELTETNGITTMNYCEGYGTQKFTSEDEAVARITTENGYFMMFSPAIKQ